MRCRHRIALTKGARVTPNSLGMRCIALDCLPLNRVALVQWLSEPTLGCSWDLLISSEQSRGPDQCYKVRLSQRGDAIGILGDAQSTAAKGSNRLTTVASSVWQGLWKLCARWHWREGRRSLMSEELRWVNAGSRLASKLIEWSTTIAATQERAQSRRTVRL